MLKFRPKKKRTAVNVTKVNSPYRLSSVSVEAFQGISRSASGLSFDISLAQGSYAPRSMSATHYIPPSSYFLSNDDFLFILLAFILSGIVSYLYQIGHGHYVFNGLIFLTPHSDQEVPSSFKVC